jgi:protein subunit release factor A
VTAKLEEIEYTTLACERPGGRHVGVWIPPLLAFHRATGIAVVVHDVERSQWATKEKARKRLEAVLAVVRAAEAYRDAKDFDCYEATQLENAIDALRKAVGE